MTGATSPIRNDAWTWLGNLDSAALHPGNDGPFPGTLLAQPVERSDAGVRFSAQ
jgi:hypothetical protein